MLVDGEHYPAVVRAAVEELRAAGRTVVGAALLGGAEKIPASVEPGWPGGPGVFPGDDYGVDVVVSGESPLAALLAGLDRFGPDEVVDLSDQPVLDARTRLLLAAHALARGVPYRGAGFGFEVPPRPRLAMKPSIAVIGTGKRTGKTAVAAELARVLVAAGQKPLIVAMGRGGPLEPEVVDPASFDLSPEALLALARTGRHAASDHLEDALTAGVVTVGTRRCGGGLAGEPASATFAAGVELANDRPEEILVFEGSGTSIPPVHADATICVVGAPAAVDPELLVGYLGAYPLLLADLVVITLVEQPLADLGAVAALEERIRGLVPGVPVVHTTFRPRPLGSISGKSIFFTTTAPPAVTGILAAHLESYGATVVGHSSSLANRPRLAADLQAAGRADVLVTELKAAAVDLATGFALERGMRVVYSDNQMVVTGGDGPLETLFPAVAALATERFRAGPALNDSPGSG
ncbi:MAG: cyclic 2,3-diphosphoglycerate synthase [Actinomycetota bacterium]|nr:cyclic 2,3-diphosphoglycerate synthase [Actinomycetota bacterium]